MLPSLALIAFSSAWALLWLRRLARGLNLAESIAAAGALTLVAVCWVPFAIARLAGLPASIVLAPLFFLGLFGGELWLALRDRTRQYRTSRALAATLRRRLLTVPGLGLGLLAAFHTWGHHLHCLREIDGAYWSAGAAWEDQSFHAALATSFALGDNLTRLSYPHVPDWPLGYPFLADFQAGWFHAAGLTLPHAFLAGNLAASLVFLLAAYVLLRRWLRSGTQALLALVFWHVAGGFGLAYLAQETLLRGSLAEAFWAHDYANAWDLELHFHNLVTGIVWPMRVVLHGLAVACGLTVFLRGLLRGTRLRTAAFALAGGVAGGLPLISAHSLVVLACVIPPLAWQHAPERRWRGWLAAMAVGAAFTLPQLAWMRTQLVQSDPPFLRWAPGWMTAFSGPHPVGDLLAHWAWNTGIWITLGAAALGLAGRNFRRETLGWWLIFPLGYLLVFQPFIFDNLKLFAAGALAAAAGCAWWVGRAWHGGIGSRLLAALLCVLISASGLQSIVSEARQPSMIADAEARRFALAVERNTPRDALILTGPQLHHPVLILAGRRVVAANHSGLSLHGVPGMLDRIGDVARIYRGAPEARALIRSLGAGWIVIGPMEVIEYPDLDAAFIDEISETVLSEGPWELRRIRSPHGEHDFTL